MAALTSSRSDDRESDTRCKPLVRKEKGHFLLHKHESKKELWNKTLLTDETKINHCQNDGKRKVRGEKTQQLATHSITSSVKHGGASVEVWAYVSANGTVTLALIDDFTADRGNGMNAEASRSVLCAQTTH